MEYLDEVDEFKLGFAKCYAQVVADKSFEMAGAAAFAALGPLMEAGAAVPGGRYVVVSRWGRPGLRPGDWLMNGPKTTWNYIRSFKWQRGFTNRFAAFDSGEEFLVPQSAVKWPGGWGFDGWWKGLFGQRRYWP